MPVRVAGDRRVESRHPGVQARHELAAEGVVAAQHRRGDLREDRGPGSALQVRGRGPLEDAPLRGLAPPFHAPDADVLDAPGVLRPAHDVVAHVDPGEPPVALDVDRGDQELGDRDLPQAPEHPPQLRRERARVEPELLRQGVGPQDLERRGAGDGRFRDGQEPAAAEVGGQQPISQATAAIDARLQARPQLRQAGFELLRLPLIGERVVARIDVLQERLEHLGDGERGSVEVGILHASDGRRRRQEAREEQRGRRSHRSDRPPSWAARPASSSSSTCSRPVARPAPAPAPPAGHAHLHVHGSRVATQPEVRAEIALGEIAAAGTNLPKLLPAARVDRHLRADREAVPPRRHHPEGHPAVSGALAILEQRGRVVHVAHHEVGIAVVVEIAHGQAAAHPRHLETPSGARRDVAEASSFIEEELVPLTVRFLELRIVLDVREDVAVREEEVQTAVQVGVEEGGPPAHALERPGGQAGSHAHVLEPAAVEIAIERVVVVGEGGEHEVRAAVAVVVARVGAHAGLGARLGVDRHPAQERHALEAAVPEVPVEEVRVRVVGHEDVDEAVVVVVGRDHAEAVGACRVREAVAPRPPPRSARRRGSRRTGRPLRAGRPGPP